MTLEQLRKDVCRANKLLPEFGLAKLYSGNASGLDRANRRVVIKPSGVEYDRITPEDLVEVDLVTGRVIDSQLRPSVDLPYHLHLYRNLPGVNGVVHTHSNYASAWAAAGRPLPVCLTGIADQFGAEIPCAPYVDNEANHIGEAIIRFRNRAPAILLAHHGAFTWGPTVTDAVRLAVVLEDVAKTAFLAAQLGELKSLPPQEVKKWYDKYHHGYGQKADSS